MITTSEIAPAHALAAFVRCYALREFDTRALNLVKPWHASHEITMPFFFKALPLHLTHPQTGQILKTGSYGSIVGLGTQYNGEMTFNGAYAFFEISFKPNGFNKIFRLPAAEITDQIMNADDVLDATVKSFYEQLCAAKGLAEMAALADAYLLYCLKKQRAGDYQDTIASVSNLILKNAGLVLVERLACDANMSIRSFERHFVEQVGISPKLFCCIARFNHAFSLKLRNPQKDWTTIACECGYFDQMHLIKDFKRFAGSAPCHFLKHTPLTKENYTSRVEA